jgi:mannose-6-phosphate isomerase-like protein (cupin superfamily)
MDRDAFEAELLREGYEVRETRYPPNEHRPPHTHDFDARLLILDGALMLVRDGEASSFGPGESCDVPAGTVHQEITDARGAHALSGRRTAMQVQAAE